MQAPCACLESSSRNYQRNEAEREPTQTQTQTVVEREAGRELPCSRQVDERIDSQSDKQAVRATVGQAIRQTDRQINGQADGMASNRQTTDGRLRPRCRNLWHCGLHKPRTKLEIQVIESCIAQAGCRRLSWILFRKLIMSPFFYGSACGDASSFVFPAAKSTQGREEERICLIVCVCGATLVDCSDWSLSALECVCAEQR